MLILNNTPRKSLERCVNAISINVTPNILDFGVVATDDTLTRSFTIENTGNFPLIVSSINLPFMPFSSYSVSWASGTINVGGSQLVNVTYSPVAEGTQNGNIIVNSNALIGDNTVQVLGSSENFFSNSLFFDGVNDIATFPNVNNGATITNFTLCVGTKNIQGNGSFVFAKTTNNGFVDAVWVRRRNNTTMNFALRNSASVTFSMDILVANLDSNDFYFTWVRSGTSISDNKIYVNGVEVTPTVTSNGVVPSINDSISYFSYDSAPSRVTGIITDFKFFNTPLSPIQVASIYASLPDFGNIPAGCVKNFPFKEKTGATVRNTITGLNEVVLTGYAPATLVLGANNAHRDLNGNPILS